MTAVLITLIAASVLGGVLAAAAPAESRWCHLGGGICLATGLVGIVAVVAVFTGS